MQKNISLFMTQLRIFRCAKDALRSLSGDKVPRLSRRYFSRREE